MPEKDSAEKLLEDYNDVFEDIANVLLFGGKRIISPDDLRPALPRSIYKAGGKTREQERDVAKYWRKDKIRIAMIGFENQTESDADMIFRTFGYDGAAYRDELNADKLGKPKERYPIIAIVLSFDYLRRWSYPLTLKETLNVAPELEPYFNDYKLNLFEIPWLSDEQVTMFKSDFRYVADYFVYLRKHKGNDEEYEPPEGTVDHVTEIMNLFSALTNENRFSAIEEQLTARERIKMRSAMLDAAEERGRLLGVDQGISQGISQGITQGENRMSVLMNKLLRDGRTQDALMATTDKIFCEKLYRAYGIE